MCAHAKRPGWISDFCLESKICFHILWQEKNVDFGQLTVLLDDSTQTALAAVKRFKGVTLDQSLAIISKLQKNTYC